MASCGCLLQRSEQGIIEANRYGFGGQQLLPAFWQVRILMQMLNPRFSQTGLAENWPGKISSMCL
jgi:hypothetical protein